MIASALNHAKVNGYDEATCISSFKGTFLFIYGISAIGNTIASVILSHTNSDGKIKIK